MNVYAIAGQSNALGISPVANLKRIRLNSDALIYQASNVRIPFERKIIRVMPGLGADEQKFGLEIGAASAFSGERCGFIKYATDGTSLYDRWSAGGEDFIGLREMFIAGMKAFSERGLAPYIRGVLWMQGENDASDKQQSAAYGRKLKEFITAVRSFMGEIAFVIGETNPHNPYLPFALEVNNAKRAVSEEMKNVFFVPTDDLTDLIDRYHYSAEHMMRLGERMANKLKEETQ